MDDLKINVSDVHWLRLFAKASQEEGNAQTIMQIMGSSVLYSEMNVCDSKQDMKQCNYALNLT